MPKSPKEMHEAIVRNLEKKTGKSLEQWIEILKKSKARDKKEQAEMLQIKYGLGNGQANTIIKMRYEGLSDYDENDLLKKHFDKEKEFQEEIYDRIISQVKKWGSFRKAVNKTYISLIHHQQFALVKTTRAGLVLAVPKDAVKSARNKEFVPAKNLGSDKITHKISLNDVTDVNDGVIKVLKASYEKN